MCRSMRIARSLAGAGILLGVLQAGHWLDVTGPPRWRRLPSTKGWRSDWAAAVLILLGVGAGDAWRLRQFVRVSAA
jgi:hypothetical protein